MLINFIDKKDAKVKERLKVYEETEIVNFSPFSINEKTGKVKPNSLPVPILVKMILNAKLVGKYLYKDYAEKTESAFDTRKGMLKIFDEETGIFKSADSFLRKIIGEFMFSDLGTMELLKCCSFAKAKSNDEIIYKVLLPSLREEINRKLEKWNNQWNVSFSKGFLSLSFTNGTLILDTTNNVINFYTFHSPHFLATIYFPVDFNLNIFKKKENRLIKFLNFKLNLSTNEKQDFFKALLFDFLYTENKSHHIICISGNKGSGKSTLKEHLMGFRKKENWCNEINLSALVGKKFSVIDWFYSQCIFTNETSKKYFEDNVMFKQLVAKETIAVEQKNIDTLFIKAFSKIFCIGEEPIRINFDGGVADRILNFKWTDEFFEFKEEERQDYKEYYKKINEPDETGKDALMQYLAFEKYEDFTDMIMQGFTVFNRNKLSDNRRAFRKKYEIEFVTELQEFARMQIVTADSYDTYLKDDKYFFIETTKLAKIINDLEIDGIRKNAKLKAQLKLLKDINMFPNYKEFYDEKLYFDVKLKNGKKYRIDKKHQYTFGINIREFDEIKSFLRTNKALMYNSNTKSTYNNILEEFKKITEEDYKKIFFNEIQLAEVVDEKKIEQVEQQALEFSEAGEEADTPHGHKTIDEMAQEIKDYFNPNKVE